jgi:4-hydroxybutyryl-CoA dehydratase/vinylacetyl-CoA-Delta-isomerase
MKREIWRHYPVPEKTALVANLLDRGVAGARPVGSRQPGRCCAAGCQPTDPTVGPSTTTTEVPDPAAGVLDRARPT